MWQSCDAWQRSCKSLWAMPSPGISPWLRRILLILTRDHPISFCDYLVAVIPFGLYLLCLRYLSQCESGIRISWDKWIIVLLFQLMAWCLYQANSWISVQVDLYWIRPLENKIWELIWKKKQQECVIGEYPFDNFLCSVRHFVYLLISK